MAASRKPPSAKAAAKAQLAAMRLRGKRIAVGLSGGVDSIVLLHVLHGLAPHFGYRLSAIHVNHGLSPNAGDWQRFCSVFCLELGIPFKAVKVKVNKKREGLEAAAREVRRAALLKLRVDAIAFGHHLDDQAETVLFNLLRGTGLAGASGMPVQGKLGRKMLLRPLLEVPRSAIRAYAAEQRLGWIEDESNADEALMRNFIRRSVGPLLAAKFPRWRESLARAARHFAGAELDARDLLRAYLKERGLLAPSEAKLVEMLKQLAGAGRNLKIDHDGVALRVYRGKVTLSRSQAPLAFKSMAWKGETGLALPGGTLNFRRVQGRGIDRSLTRNGTWQVRLRRGGERLRLNAKRPRRTLKNLFQEAGIPPWERDRLPLLFCGDALVWVPGLGVDAEYLSADAGILPEWHPFSSSA